jgi:hypothetical protein
MKKSNPNYFERSKILVNGHLYADLHSDMRSTVSGLLSYIDIENSPLHAIKRNLQAIFDIVTEHFSQEREFYKGKERSAIIKFIKNMQLLRDTWEGINIKEVLARRYFEYILSLDGLGTLPGFGVQNKMGDTLYGNPEKISIMKAHEKLG